MRQLQLSLLIVTLAGLLFSCSKKLELNAEWKDITIVYGILNQQDTIHYIKITKAFLGPGNAIQYAQIPDSSNYPIKLDVSLEAWNGSDLVAIYRFDTVTIHDKDSGEYFYFPNQLVYFNDSILDANYLYKLTIRDPETEKKCTSQTLLVHDFTIEKPMAYQKIAFRPGMRNPVEWYSAIGGKRYQVIIRFEYLETSVFDPTQSETKYVDWIVFPNEQSRDVNVSELIKKSYAADGFYAMCHANIPVNPDVIRAARYIHFLFLVAGDDLNTYIEVSQPSNSIIQEKPAYSNIENGIGLFSARFLKVRDSHQLATETIQELKVNPLTYDLGF
ncbi:MAG: hypothetical protein V1733_05750 [bacterium]